MTYGQDIRFDSAQQRISKLEDICQEIIQIWNTKDNKEKGI